MSGWSLLYYLSAAVVYAAVAATIWGWIRNARKARKKWAVRAVRR